jgi:nicotinamide-nucleotide amidase
MTETLSSVLPADLEARVHHVLKMLFDRELTVATAESCTGGLLSSILTDVDGYGHIFERGFVVYSEAAKTELLGVAPEILESEGAVSKATAIAMAQGALGRSKADIVIAVTGFAGPAGPDDMPGLVHFACQRRGGPVDHRRKEFGTQNRGAVRIAAMRTAIAMLEHAAGAGRDLEKPGRQ